MSKILVLHGPNLNLLGTREPEHYGVTTLADIDSRLRLKAEHAKIAIELFQSNSEAALIDCVQAAPHSGVDFIIINPAAFTHTSVALRDALSGVAIPFIEVHLSNVYTREAFRHQSYFSDIAVGIITGLGAQSYEFALEAAIRTLSGSTPNASTAAQTENKQNKN